ncbi:hypothetical protein WM016_07015 [Bifidobacterium mongoliense]|uniref:hypothetical protein n=1 Tax=Bifidobacterium mongoliense TaxID=518643 RepID=UPI0030ED666B
MPINILSDQMLRVLRIIQVSNDSGYYPSTDEIDSLVKWGEPLPSRHVKKVLNRYEALGLLARGIAPEDVIEVGDANGCGYLDNVGWIKVHRDEESEVLHWEISDFGRIIAAHEVTAREGEDDEVFCVNFDSKDPLVYSKLLQILSAEGHDMLVDPYFKAEYLEYIAKTKLTRILMMKDSGSDNRANRERIALDLGELKRHNYPFPEVRTVAKNQLHDRFLVDRDGTVYMLGTSINSLDQHTSSLLRYPYISGRAPKDLLETLWRQGTVISPAPVVDDAR